MTKPVGPETDSLSGQAQARLRILIERIERLIEDRDNVNADIKEVFAEAKGEGFDTKIMRKIIRITADRAKFNEEAALIDLYLSALGLL